MLRAAGPALLACALALAASARAAESPELAQAIETTRASYPKLVHFGEGDHFLVGVDDAELAKLRARVAAGDWSAETEAAVFVVLEGFSREQGPAATFGRNLTSDITGDAAMSGSGPTLEGVSRILERFLADESHPYSILAQALLAEKIRCGAASQGDDELVQRITKAVNPDKEFDFGSTDGTVADRYGIHPKADLYSVAASGARVVAVGYFGSVLVSRDGGTTWETPATGTDEPLYAVALGPGDEVWAAGRAGVMLHSKDSGRSWLRRPTPFARHIFGLFASAPETVLAVGDFGLQLRTVDGGGHWACIPRAQDVILGRLTRAGADAVGVGEFGTIERLSAGLPPGARGALHGVPGDTYVYDAWFDADGKTGVAVGLAGTILRSSDGGATWDPVKTAFTQDLFGVGGSGARVVVTGEGGLLAVSSDGGLTFAPAESPPLPVPLNDVDFADESHVFAVGPRGLVLRSSDGGAHFSLVHPGSGS
ncbi:MAG: WD40/YVTN/BNR-like repeat-containing protein [Myxococcota bacterium]